MTPRARLLPPLVAACLLALAVFLTVFPPRTAQAQQGGDLVGKQVLVKMAHAANPKDIVDFFEGKVLESNAMGVTVAATKVVTVREGRAAGSEWKVKLHFPWSSILYMEIKG